MHCLFYVLSLKEVSKAILSNMVNKANSSVQIWEPYQISFQVRLPYVKSEINQPVQAYNASTCTICLGLQGQYMYNLFRPTMPATCTICLGLQCQYMYNLLRPTMPIHVQSVQAYNANTCTICLGLQCQYMYNLFRPTMPIHVQSVQAYNASTCTTCSNQVSVAQSVSTFDC